MACSRVQTETPSMGWEWLFFGTKTGKMWVIIGIVERIAFRNKEIPHPPEQVCVRKEGGAVLKLSRSAVSLNISSS